jgi:hypothetical protein
MKTLLLLNGANESQKGIEDGFLYLKSNETISDLKWFYFEPFAEKNGVKICIEAIEELAKEFLPRFIVIFHISKFPISDSLIFNLRNISSKPKIVYDEGDMYGGLSKPLTKSMKTLIRGADYVSIRGLGNWLQTIRKINSSIIYTPHSNSLHRFTQLLQCQKERENSIVFIGNRVTSRIGNIRRLKGAAKREKLVKYVSKSFPDKFKIYGSGWNKLDNCQGILPFFKQSEVCSNSWIQISYEHFPNIPFYFSDRLPIALSCGQVYVTHYHIGYEHIFNDCDFIYFYKSEKEAVEILTYLLSLSRSELYEKGYRAKQWSDKHLNPNLIWGNLMQNII